MSKQNPAELPGGMAILGILVRKPNLTVADVQEILDMRFASCRFHRTLTLNTLQRMIESKRGRPRVRRVHCEPDNSLLDRYATTEAGAEVFGNWMAERPGGKPAIRDALDGRIVLCTLEDLPALIRIGREERDLADFEFSEAKTELTRHLRRSRRRGALAGPLKREDLEREAHAVLLHVSPERWSQRSEQYDEVVKRLEDVCRRGGIEFPPEP